MHICIRQADMFIIIKYILYLKIFFSRLSFVLPPNNLVFREDTERKIKKGLNKEINLMKGRHKINMKKINKGKQREMQLFDNDKRNR